MPATILYHLVPVLGLVIAAVSIVWAWRRIPPGAPMPSFLKGWRGQVPRGLSLTILSFTVLLACAVSWWMVETPDFGLLTPNGLFMLMAGLGVPLFYAVRLAELVAERRKSGLRIRD